MIYWREYPECPSCGAIQGPVDSSQSERWAWVCHACGKSFVLDVQVRYRGTKEED